MSETDGQRPRLTASELVQERLCLRTASLIDEVYDLAKRQIASEEKRESNLSSKAVSLLGVTGLCLTVAFTFGGVLLQRPVYLASLGSWRFIAVVVPYALAIVCGLAASGFALQALLVRSDYRDVEEHDVFGPELAKADEAGEDGVSSYKRFIAAHLWLIYQETFKIHEDKAATIARGQKWFFGFLLFLVPIGGAMTYSLSVASDAPVGPAPVSCVVRLDDQKPAAPAPALATQPAKPPPTTIPATGRRVQGNVKTPISSLPPAGPRPN